MLIISNCERSEKFGSCETTPSKICLCVCMCVCLSVCLSIRPSVTPSVRPSVFYLLLDHRRDRNGIFRDRKHQALDGYYILKTYCYNLNFKVICENSVSRLILVAHIHTYVAQETPWPTSYLSFYPYLQPPTYFLPPTSLSTSSLPFYRLPPFLPPTSYLQSPISNLLPPFLPPSSLSTFYLLPPFLPSTSLSTSYLPFYLTPVEKLNILHSNISHRYQKQQSEKIEESTVKNIYNVCFLFLFK